MVSPPTDSSVAGRSASHFHGVPGRVFFYLKIALVFAALFASPVIFLQIWRFISPGLYRHEKKILVPFTAISTLCFLAGTAFGYYIVFPPAFNFLLGYSSEFLEPMPAVNEYFSLALRLFLAFGLVFELPVFMVLLGKAGLVDKPFLVKNRKYALLMTYVVAAVLTPPDVVSQFLMAGPLIVLYEVSIVAVAVFARRPFSSFNTGNGGGDGGMSGSGSSGAA
ncbi:twin-arginine translocase subunit TatC [Desulfobulbus alkaliphilus]|nr:twin-arginine translocase subunit TatC [Desulfobulbus alkaliphilus]